MLPLHSAMSTGEQLDEGIAIRDATEGDLPAIVAIYNAYVRTTTVTWDEADTTLEGRQAWLRQRRELALPVLVAADAAGRVLGYASLSPFRPWSGYRHAAEHGIYLQPDACGRGLGRRLLYATLGRARARGLHCIVACMDATSEASLRLHAACGFARVAHMPQVGRKFGEWRDLVIMQRLLD
jgi:phosphinothricin acetyltransferase